MRLSLFIYCVLLLGVARGDDWQPPENPDPAEILQQAKASAHQGDHAVALAMHLWYHEHAVELQPSQSAVRLSFALSDWLELGEEYPPALAKLREIRDETEARIRDESRVRVRSNDFHDFTALNRTLRDEKRTVAAFRWLSESDFEDSNRMYGISEAALIKHKEFALCGEYIQPDEDVSKIEERFKNGVTLSKKFGKQHQDYVEKKMVNESALLVAILVQTDRMEEAKAAAVRLKQIATEPKLLKKLQRAIDESLNGVVPTPWP